MSKVNILVVALVGLLASSALGACPDLIGIWSSNPETNPDYPLLNGRYSEAWCSGVGPLVAGNTINAMSFDGATLGLEWRMEGMSIDAAGTTLVFDGVSGGNGVRIYQTAYNGGTFWLGGDGVWTFGDVELNGVIADFQIVSTQYIVGGQITAVVCNITFNGIFDDCGNDCVIEFAIANAAQVWQTGSNDPMPANYPGFLCSANSGELYTTSDITIGINCAVSAENQNWSSVKETFR